MLSADQNATAGESAQHTCAMSRLFRIASRNCADSAFQRADACSLIFLASASLRAFSAFSCCRARLLLRTGAALSVPFAAAIAAYSYINPHEAWTC